uniref:PA2779 family protein n=1 Tax=Candidatus Nitrotoga fabula TaxID=2182327 RepID=A0A2X0QTW5_9PROT|nr:conserved exported protein of unknown function [Candidatus Nitrotoga fabula]
MKRLQRLLAVVLTVSLINTTMIQSAQAALVSTEEVARIAAVDQAVSGHARLADAMGRAEVRTEMERLGVDPVFAAERVAALTDEEAGLLADQINSAPAGDGGIIGAILLVFFVLLITDILGFTKIFPFTRSVR